MGAVADEQSPVAADPGGAQFLNLTLEGREVDDHAVSDHAYLIRMQYSRGYQMQHVLLTVDDHRVTGVVSSLIAGYHIEVCRQQIDDLALAFITPLSTYHDEISHHNSRLQTTGSGLRIEGFPNHLMFSRPAEGDSYDPPRDTSDRLQMVINHLGDRIFGRVTDDLLFDDAILEE